MFPGYLIVTNSNPHVSVRLVSLVIVSGESLVIVSASQFGHSVRRNGRATSKMFQDPPVATISFAAIVFR